MPFPNDFFHPRDIAGFFLVWYNFGMDPHHYGEREIRELPKPPHWTKAIGVGIVVTGLAIGTGELILWPHLIARHGLDLLWLALLGLTCQFFINHEVARNELATGEGFFTASARVLKYSVFFWLISAILLY